MAGTPDIEKPNLHPPIPGGSIYPVSYTHLDVYKRQDWTPIGTDYDNSYKGTFDGGGHTITGLTFTTNDEYACLFGWLNRAGTVKNVVMECVQITSHQIYGGSIGGVVGSGWGTIEN